MDKWAPLAADRLYDGRSQRGPRRLGNAVKKIGRLPEEALVVICQWLPVHDALSLGRCCRRLRAISLDDRVWSRKLQWLSCKGLKAATASNLANGETPGLISEADASVAFGEFVTFTEPALGGPSASGRLGAGSLSPADDEIDLASPSPTLHLNAPSTIPKLPINAAALRTFQAQFLALVPFIGSLQTHSTSSLLFTTPSLVPFQRAQLMATLTRFFNLSLCCIQEPLALSIVRRNLQSAMDVFEGSLLSEFERFDDRKDEQGMHNVAHIVWELGHGGASVVQTYVGKREIFYDTRFNPLENVVRGDSTSGHHGDGVDFAPLERFMSHVCSTVASDGAAIARIFPPEGDVVIQYIDRLAVDVLSEYIATLLGAAQTLQPPLYLLATAAVFTQLQRIVPIVLEVAPPRSSVKASRVNEMLYRIFEVHMDDYLQEEADWIKEVLGKVCADVRVSGNEHNFLATENPTQAKRNVLSSFTKALLLPVTIVPKTVSYSFNAITYVGNEAFNTVAQLGSGLTAAQHPEGYSSTKHATDVETWLEDDHQAVGVDTSSPTPNLASGDGFTTQRDSSDDEMEPQNAGATAETARHNELPRLQTLLSLDVAVQLISADREALKRVQAFSGFPGAYGAKVQDTLEEIFIVLLQTLLGRHVEPAFQRAFRHMKGHRAEAHQTESAVAPLIEFFELVHVGDMVQQMVQAYFDKEMAATIDRTDFLNAVIREKKHFESSLDDAVAQGLNIGVDILMDQTEHILASEQSPRDFAPEEGEFDLVPTRACRLVIDCLATHCSLLKGSTDKHIMEVFYQEVGLRLHTLLCKHLKRCIISIEGGFQLIADLNAYYDFIVAFKQAHVTVYFTALKTVGSLFIIASPKDLGQLARDVHRFDGTLRSEDLYEFVQRRADWKRIEKAVDREIYGLGKEDCLIS